MSRHMALLLLGHAAVLTALLCRTIPAAAAAAAVPSDAELRLVKSRFTSHIADPDVELKVAEGFAQNLQHPQCNWSDINYKDKTRGDWATAVHMDRVVYMASALPLKESLASSVACSQ